MNVDIVLMLAIVIGVILMIANFYVAHSVMHFVNKMNLGDGVHKKGKK